MIKNITLVQIFLSHFYRQRVDKLEDFVSPNFSYQSPAIKPVNFLSFVEHCNHLFQNVSIAVEQVKTHNDRFFQIQYSIHIRGNDGASRFSIPGRANILVINSLIENIIVTYNPNLLVKKPVPKPSESVSPKSVFMFD